MENKEAEASTNKLETLRMFGVDTRCRVDLQHIAVVSRVFEQTPRWIEHLAREHKEELSGSILASLHDSIAKKYTLTNHRNRGYFPHQM